jgi:hypothetical protein
MTENHASTHGLRGRALPFLFLDEGEDPPIPLLGRLLVQSPNKRRWAFPSGAVGRHDPELRRRLQEANGE